MHIFTYGSLMFPMVWSRVVRGHYNHAEALLSGYIRRAVIGEHYPVVLKSSSNQQVPGVIYFDVTPVDIERLDLFEGPQYERIETMICLADNRHLDAGVYILRDSYRTIAAAWDWDPEQFRQNGLRQFLRSYLGFTSLPDER